MLSAEESIFRLRRSMARNAGERSITLIGVTKTHPVEAILPFLAAGLQDLGENRVQEAAGKLIALRAAFPALRAHLLGPLQSNKIAEAARLFDVVHSIDRVKIAQGLGSAAHGLGKTLDVFVQVNIGREPQKAGVAIEELDALLETVRAEKALRLLGLMGIPPADTAPAPYFALLEDVAKRRGLNGLSMGMSGDYGKALHFGATHLRIGTALFGERRA